MAILAIDTCLEQCSVSLLLPDGQLVEQCEDRTKGHAERLPLMVREILIEAGMAAKNLTKTVVTTGPGSFTGVRVGLAFARGMAIGQSFKLHGMTSFEALALSASDSAGNIITLIDARRGQIYGQVFGRDNKGLAIPQGDPFVEDPQDAAKRLEPLLKNEPFCLTGSGVALAFPDQTTTALFPQTAIMARHMKGVDVISSANPLYLRAPDAKPKRQTAV
jgi:tRNA threonylcarbamoyladenosine biosynthesis protein TsaB